MRDAGRGINGALALIVLDDVVVVVDVEGEERYRQALVVGPCINDRL